jgi:hypothetical protein
MVERLFKLKLAIEYTIVDPNWTTFVNLLRASHHKKSLTKAKVVPTNIRKDEFGILVLTLYTWWNWSECH